MNPMTNVKNIKKLSEEELKGKNKTSWHEQYRGSAWIFVGGLPYDLTEGDIICVFSQYGEPLNVNLVRDKETGKSKGFCFICYEDQRSTDLAVDNLNGIKILGRTLRVDHVENYKPPKSDKDEHLRADSRIKKEKKQRDRVNDGNDSITGVIGENGNEFGDRTKTRKNQETDHRASSNTKKDKRPKKKRKKGDENSNGEFGNESKKKIKRRRTSSDSRSSLSPSPSPSTASSSSTSSSSSSSAASSSSTSSSSASSSSSSSSSRKKCDGTDKKHKRKEKEKYHKQKRNRTIEDLKREARLIQAELKRRQQLDEETKTPRFSVGEKQYSGTDDRKFKFREGEKDSRRENSKDRHRNSERRHYSRRDDRRDRSTSPTRERRHSKSSTNPRENGHGHRYR